MRANEALAKIPILTSANRAARARGLSWQLRLTRFGTIALLVFIPISGIFRIDLSSGFVVLGRQVWFSDFHIVFGLWLAIACGLVMLYSTLGNVFCGWACPQNTFSTWANDLTKKHLGKRAVIDWNNEKSANLASGKNNIKNWLYLSLKLLLGAMFIALIPMLYFYPPGAVWSFITFQEDARLAGSLHWIYTVFTFIALVNLAVIRHFICRYMCIYRMWQFLFKTKDTLHIVYDESRAADCEKCNFCATTCSVDINPKQTQTYDSCINCGECITACDSLHEKKGLKGLLRFKLGPRQSTNTLTGCKENIDTNLATATQRLTWVAPVFLFAIGLFIWGLSTYAPYHLTVYQGEVPRGETVQDYHINVANKLYKPSTLTLSIEGLPEGSYRLEKEQISFDTATRQDVTLHIEQELEPGLHPILIKAQSQDGWSDSFRILHLSERAPL